jgi:radical SAM protein with 4Fe4S-binding SPASM domain
MTEPCAVTHESTDRYKAIMLKSQNSHRLVGVHWELTYRCNEKCTHCYLDVLAPGAKVPGELDFEEAKRVIDELAELGAMTITFSGGEILVHKDFFDIATYARKRGFAVRLYTNGILIKPEVADKIAALRPVAIELSIYGADAATHDMITLVPGSWELTVRAAKLLKERGVKVTLKAPIMRENWEQMEAMRELAREVGAGFSYDITIVPKHTGDRSPLKHRLNDGEMLEVFRRELGSWVLVPYREDYRFCGIGLTSMTIGPYGEVFSCVGARVSAGNVREQPLAAIWRDNPVWQEMTNLTLGNLPVCAKCELRQYCVRCHGTAAFEDGDMLGCSSVAYREARLRRQALLEKGVH